MGNFLLKKSWTPEDWHVFHSNINILLSEHRIKKYEFSEIVGVKNFFRTDRKRVSLGVIEKICDQFDVTQQWLETLHIYEKADSPGKDLPPDIKQDISLDMSNSDGSPPRENGNQFDHKMSAAFTRLSKIYESGDLELIRAAFVVIDALARKSEKKGGK